MSLFNQFYSHEHPLKDGHFSRAEKGSFNYIILYYAP